MSAPFPTPERLWYAPSPSLRERALQTLLRPLSWLYRAVSSLHAAAYRLGVLQVQRAPIPVIAVGNLVAGGAGKTPVTMELARLALLQGHRPAILSRGYGAPIPPHGLIVSTGAGPLLPAAQCGDEAWLMAQGVAGCAVLAGPNRAHLAMRAAKELGCTLAILDDGMQHHRLHKDALVVVCRVPQPLGNGLLLPAGPLRQSPSALLAAHTVILLGPATSQDRALLQALHLPPDHVVTAALEPTRLTQLDGSAWTQPTVARLSVVAAAGVGRPQSFAHTLEQAGAKVLHLHALADHASPTLSQWQELLEDASQRHAAALVVTAKDAAKVPPGCSGPVPILVQQAALHWEAGAPPERLQSLLGALGR